MPGFGHTVPLALAAALLGAHPVAAQSAGGGSSAQQAAPGGTGAATPDADDVEYEAVDEPLAGGGVLKPRHSVHGSNDKFAMIKEPGFLPLVAPRPARGLPVPPPATPQIIGENVLPSTIAQRSPGEPADAGQDGETPGEPQARVPHAVRSSLGRKVRQVVPWQVQIYQPWTLQEFKAAGKDNGRPLWSLQHLCGGSLIAWGWVLTAAHCLANEDGAKNWKGRGYMVRLGAIEIEPDQGWSYRIDRVIRYKDYHDPGEGEASAKEFDVAMVHFRDGPKPPPGKFAEIPLDIGDPPPDGARLYATGWGRTEGGVEAGRAENIVFSPILLKVDLNLVPETRCAALWRSFAANGRHICTASGEGRQTCQGDSGGPLVNADGDTRRLIGVVGWNNFACHGEADKPGGYARVASFANWIEGIIEGKQ